MDASILESYLRRGLSLEAIGKLTGRHPSTVGYWVKQHGLAAVHRDRHAPRGGIDAERLTILVGEGLSTREIADRLNLSQSTVRHWLRKHDLRTHRARRPSSAGVRGVDPDRRMQECSRHGICGYDRYIGALQFHHRDGLEKAFRLGDRGLTRSLEAVRAEAAKCLLLCGNCHSEVEAGIVSVD